MQDCVFVCVSFLFYFLWQVFQTWLIQCFIWVLVFMQLKMGCCARLKLPSTDDVTWDHTPPVTSAQVQPSTDFICLCLLIDSQSVMLVLQYIMAALTSGKHSSLTCKSKSDIFKHPLTHISSIPKGRVEWLLVMLEQVLDIRKAFNLEDLWFLLNDLPEATDSLIRATHINLAKYMFNFSIFFLLISLDLQFSLKHTVGIHVIYCARHLGKKT